MPLTILDSNTARLVSCLENSELVSKTLTVTGYQMHTLVEETVLLATVMMTVLLATLEMFFSLKPLILISIPVFLLLNVRLTKEELDIRIALLI